jgi:hypothetical protein
MGIIDSFSPIKFVGSLVSRVNDRLNADSRFMRAIAGYYYANNCVFDDKFHLRYYPGTHSEINACVIEQKNPRYKFPALMYFVPMKEQFSVSGNMPQHSLSLDLAICASTLSNWLTEQREEQTMKLVLRPIYNALIDEIKRSAVISQGYGVPAHTKISAPFTGTDGGLLVKQWGEYIDAIELHNLSLTVSQSICLADYAQMDEEYQNLYLFNN